MEADMAARNEFDFETMDYRSLTPEQVGRLHREVMAAARAERVRLAKVVVRWLATRLPRAIATWAREQWRTYRRWRDRRAAAAELHRLTDYELRDIGLRRSEIYAAVNGLHRDDVTIRHRGEAPRKPELRCCSRNDKVKPARREELAEKVRIKPAA
jgi:uncharacterized protein YjiS (DUF1127 family)